MKYGKENCQIKLLVETRLKHLVVSLEKMVGFAFFVSLFLEFTDPDIMPGSKRLEQTTIFAEIRWRLTHEVCAPETLQPLFIVVDMIKWELRHLKFIRYITEVRYTKWKMTGKRKNSQCFLLRA